MSEQEKKDFNKHPVTGERVAGWWRKAKFLIPIYDAVKVCVIVGGVIWGVGLTIENRIAEVLANPKKTAMLIKQDSTKFQFVDSSLIKHNGYFSVIFQRVDSNANVHRR